jgi:cysteine protease ATG4
MDIKGWNLFLASGDDSDWEHIDGNCANLPVPTNVCVPAPEQPHSGFSGSPIQPAIQAPDSSEFPSRVTDTAADIAVIRPLSSSDLSWSDGHFSESSDRMFKSLDLDRSQVLSGDIGFEYFDEQRQHHSLGDVAEASRTISYHSSTNRTMSVVRNGAVQVGYDEEDDDDDVDDDIESVKNALLSAWTNARNGWIVKTSTSFKHDSPIWLLGCLYTCTKAESNNKKKERGAAVTSFDEFKLDFKSRLWFTYRTDLPTLPGSHLRSDVGWGCMLRCGQMLVAQALIVHFLHRDWRWHPSRGTDETWHRQIIRYFGDASSPNSPFSIQTLVTIGHESGRKAGDWYGPASIAYALRSALLLSQQQVPNGHLSTLSIYIARDGVVYKQDILDECYGIAVELSETYNKQQQQQQQWEPNLQQVTNNNPQPVGNVETQQCHATVQQSLQQQLQATEQQENQQPQQSQQELSPRHWRSVIVLIPMRLGGETVNPMYVPYIKTLLNCQHCIGIIGGKPKHSLYFIGWQEDKLIYLDPHCCQEFVDVHSVDFPLQTFHCQSPRKLSFSKMDPSCAVGFYCQTRSELDTCLHELSKITSPPHEHHYPMFHVEDGRLADVVMSCDITEVKTVRANFVGKKGHDDFTLL